MILKRRVNHEILQRRDVGVFILNPDRRGNLLGALEVVVMKTWPINCSWCGKEVARAIMPHSHGICEPCADRLVEDAKELKGFSGPPPLEETLPTDLIDWPKKKK